MDIYEEIRTLRMMGKSCIILTITKATGSVPRHIGAKMLVKADGSILDTVGGGAIEKRLIEEALKSLETGEPKSVDYDLDDDLGMSCGGKVSAFIEPLISAPQLIIFGAGHIGSVLIRLGKMLGFRIVVADNRPDFANQRKLPNADQIFAAPYHEILRKLNFDESTYIVIVTHQHAHDQEVLEYCVRQPFAYLGMIGSKTKVVKSFKILREQGIDEALLTKIHSPIGLDIGAETPEEIAIAIAAELVVVRRKWFINSHMRQNKE